MVNRCAVVAPESGPMEQGTKSAKAKVEARPTVARKPRTVEASTGPQFKQRLAEALEQHAAIGEILRVISSSPGDVTPVLATVAKRAAHLCDASFAQVLLVEGNVLRPTVAYWADAGSDEERDDSRGVKRTWPLTRSMVIGRAVLDCKTIHHADVVPLLDSEYPDSPRAKQRELGFRAVLAVPLMREGGASGVIFIYRREPRPFSPEQVALVETFARQAAIAIENVRLFKETKEALEQQTATSAILRVISQSPTDVQTVFDAIVKSAVRLCEARFGAVFRLDRGLVYLAACHNFTGALLSRMQSWYPMMPNRGHVSGRTILTGTAVQVPDILADEEYLGTTLKEAGFRSLLGLPLLRGGSPIGAIVIYRAEPGQFENKHFELLKTFADQAVIAIENARLFREIEDKSRQLEIASQHKSEFLANMSHELRTPLNAIIGFSEVLSERMFGDINEKQAEYISDILQSGQHLLSLINDILDLSKIEAGRMELELSDFDLPSSIENTLTLVRERAVRRGIELGHTVDEHLGMVRADERRVKQVLLNLLSNALKFTPEGGRIDVRAAVRDGMAEISVADTGVGISPEDQELVFEEFRQVGTAAKKVEGTGLGLAISRKFIEVHGGRIWVESQVGKGSTFAFTLPLSIDHHDRAG